MRRPDAAPALRAEGMDVAVGDLTDPASLARAVKGCDAVAHFAGVLGDEAASWARFMAVNVYGTRSLLVAAVEAGCALSLRQLRMGLRIRCGPGTDETSPAGPCGDPYYDTKLMAQALVLDAARRGGSPRS